MWNVRKALTQRSKASSGRLRAEKARSRLLRVEGLEQRAMLAAAVAAPGIPYLRDNTVLQVPCTSGADTVRVSGDLSRVTVLQQWQGGSRTTTYTGVKSFDVNLGEGNNSFQNDTALPSAVYGGSGKDAIIGGSAADAFFGRGGDDTLKGRGGADKLDGGGGSDWLYGGDGQDTLVAGDQSGSEANTVNYLFGGDGKDSLSGGGGDDYLYGEQSDDTLWDPAKGHLWGGAGNDELRVTIGCWGSEMHGGPGNDKLFYRTSIGSWRPVPGDDFFNNC